MKILEGFVSGEPAKPYVASLAYPGWDWEIYHKPLSVNIEAGTIQAGFFFKDSVGQAGLAFYVQNVSYDHWQMYTVYFDSATNQVKLDKWLDGTRTNLGSLAFIIPLNTSLWLGADFSEHSSNGTIRVHASAVEGNLIRADTLKLTITDHTLESTGSVGIVRSNSATFRTMDFTAGSPAHAEVADEAKALRGPILGDNDRRIHYDNGLNRFRYTDDGLNFGDVAAPAPDLSTYLQRVSANRPGVTKLYRRDDDSGYNIQTHWTGSHWWLRGYSGDTFHAECRVGYADVADLAGYNTSVYLAANYTTTRNQWSTPTWAGYDYNGGAATWDSATALYPARNGLYEIFGSAMVTGLSSSTGTLYLAILVSGNLQWMDNGGAFSTTYDHYCATGRKIYLTTSQYVQLGIYWKNSNYHATVAAAYTRLQMELVR